MRKFWKFSKILTEKINGQVPFLKEYTKIGVKILKGKSFPVETPLCLVFSQKVSIYKYN